MQDNTVKIDAATGAPRCPWHGPQVGAEYGQQDPAPCGCAWVWSADGHRLEAVPSRADLGDLLENLP